MKAIIINTVLHFQHEFIEKNKFNDIVNVKGATIQQWYDWGFRDYVFPTYTNLQKLGDLYFDIVSDTITYYVIDKTQIEIDQDTLNLQQDLINQQQSNKEAIILEKMKLQVETQLTDINLPVVDIIASKAFYDYWVIDKVYTSGNIVNTFDDQLYRCVQGHTSQTDWHPSLVPALFTAIVAPETVGIWVQPTGAQDAYNIGDKVHFPLITDPIYESLINANTWSPTSYPAGWALI